MKPSAFSGLTLTLAVTVLAGFWLPHLRAADTPPSEQQLAEINTAIDRVKAWLEQANLQHPEYEQNLQAVELRLATVTRQISTTRNSIDAGNTQLNALQQQQQQLLAQKRQQTEIIKQLIRAAYMEGSQSMLKLVLNQEDPAEAARMLYYHRLINEHRLAQVQDYERTLTNLENTELEIQNSNNKLITENEKLALQLQEMEMQRQARQQALATLEASIAERDAELQKLQADREALELLLEEVQRAMEAIPLPGSQQPFAQRQAGLPWPGSGSLLSRFGDRYGNGELQRQGITLDAETGDPVRAVHGGRVVFANWLRGSGHLMILDHGDGYLSLYGYNETLTQQQGDWVNAGEVIATAGNSGGQRQSGIYFEIRYNGRPVDPLAWLEPENR